MMSDSRNSSSTSRPSARSADGPASGGLPAHCGGEDGTAQVGQRRRSPFDTRTERDTAAPLVRTHRLSERA